MKNRTVTLHGTFSLEVELNPEQSLDDVLFDLHYEFYIDKLQGRVVDDKVLNWEVVNDTANENHQTN